MALNQIRKKKKISTYNPQSDKIINELANVLTNAGYEVRREKLKQGYGWKVLSGACQLEEKELIFVDRKLPQDEQISFLIGKLLALQVPVKKSNIPNVSDKLIKQFKELLIDDTDVDKNEEGSCVEEQDSEVLSAQ